MLNMQNWPGLIQKINESGYQIHQVDNELVGVKSADGTSGQQIENEINSIIDGYSVEDCANYVCLQIEKMATSKRNVVVSPYSPGEMAAWPIKRAEALTYQSSGNPSDVPNLNAEAASRGMSLQTLVTKVLSDAARFSWIEAHIAGTSGKHRDAIRTCQTIEEITSYNYNTGWPV